MCQSTSTRQLVSSRSQVRIEEIFPGPPRNRPRFELRQVDSTQRERTQRFEQCAGLVGQGEHNRSLIWYAVVDRPAADDEKTCEIVVEILNGRGQRCQAEDLAGAGRSDRGSILETLVCHELGAAGRVVRSDDLHTSQSAKKSFALRQCLGMGI